MIIQSIRLKNIKSYGEGPDGNGVTVQFQPGVNRIAGLNGHGKTTLIECLGYALFRADPVFEENFKTETYFLRHGAKTGEIDVTFSFNSEAYRIERGIGAQNKRRSKVVQVSDGSICAEGDAEVGDFLCRLLSIPSPSRLAETFSKLIGVKQGRLTLPFDSKGGDAKKFFEPLLEVEVFRQCFDQLKPALDIFREDMGQHRTHEATVNERIRERADSHAKLVMAQKAVAERIAILAKSIKARDMSLREKAKQEKLEKSFDNAKTAKDKADVATGNAKDKRIEAGKRASESDQAAKRVAESKTGYKTYESAEKALKELETKRRTRDGLRTKREKAEGDRKESESNAQSARDQERILAEQKRQKERDLAKVTATAIPLQSELEAGKDEFNRMQDTAEKAADDLTVLRTWIRDLPRVLKRLKSTSGAIAALGSDVAAWDPARIKAARKAEENATDALARAKDSFAQASERKATLSGQLSQIRGGVCPFLKESCRQFDAAKVKTDLSELAAEETRLAQIVARTQEAYDSAHKALTPLVAAESQLEQKQEQLTQKIDAYAEDLSSAVTPEVKDTIKRIRAWHDAIPPFPVMAGPSRRELAAERVTRLQESMVAFAADVDSWWTEAEPMVKERLEEAKAAGKERTRKETNLKNLKEQLTGLEKEISRLTEEVQARGKDAKRWDKTAAVLGKTVENLEDQLRPYSHLDGDIDTQNTIRDNNKAAHERYLKFKSLADELEARREQFQQRQAEEAKAAGIFKEKTDALKKAQDAFDARKLRTARADYEKRLGEATAADTNLSHTKEELAIQETRFREWETACQEREKIVLEIARCDAAVDVTELARKTLRDAAPAVAQHLCNRIAARAQAVFNQISHEPVELEWMAEHYSLRITPSDRRFAMLSGGEQTKLALAMTLSMVEEFSGLRFCIFDEPTYGVDADSRRKLADAILEAQKAAGLEQLLLVSHDDAFEGKIEHAVLLIKSAAAGTTVELMQ